MKVANSVYLSYHKTAIGGVIYLYNLTHDRFSGVARRSLEKICRLCEGGSLGKLVLSTTNGERLAPEERGRRERKLATDHWKPIIDKGAVVHHFRREASSAWELIKEFIPPPSELEGTSQTHTSIATVTPPPDPQIAAEEEKGSSSLTLDYIVLDDSRKTDIVIPYVRLY
jgi:hypothetical protein